MLAAELRVKKRRHAAFAQRGQNDRIRVLARPGPDNQRVDDKRHDEHAAQQNRQDARIAAERRKPGVGQVAGDKSEDSDRREPDDDAHDVRDRVGNVGEHLAGCIRRHGGGKFPAEPPQARMPM